MNKEIQPSIQAVIFDLDGTLLDSVDVWHRIDIAFLAKRGHKLPEDYARAVSLMHLQEAAAYTAQRFALADTPADIMAEWREMAYDAYARQIPMKPGAKDFLCFLRERGKRLAVATALERELAMPALERHGIVDWFEAVVCTSDVGEGKSSPAVFLKTADALKVAPERCVVFEDTLGGVRSAKAAGMYTVAVQDSGAQADRDTIRQVADAYWTSFIR